MKLLPFTAWAIVGPDGSVTRHYCDDDDTCLHVDDKAIALSDWWVSQGYRIARVRVAEIDEDDT